jgi:hypothetical protein
MTVLKAWAAALGADVSGRGVICPGPQHSPLGRSLSVKIAGDDPIDCKDSISSRLKRQRGNLPIRFSGSANRRNPQLGALPPNRLRKGEEA